MPRHEVLLHGIIYVIPTDELYEKYLNGEAIIDKYGRLMNQKPYRILRELECYSESEPLARQDYNDEPTSLSPEDYIKVAVQEGLKEAGRVVANKAIKYFSEEVLPRVWEEKFVPFCQQAKEALTAKELKAQTLLSQAQTSVEIAETPRITLTQQETDAEKRKILYYWLNMLNSLKKLHDAGEIDANIVLAQLTDPARLQDVNCLLSEHPNLLEADQHITLHSLLGRNLYEEKQLIPITAEEIITIAETYGYAEVTEKMEENHNGRADDDL